MTGFGAASFRAAGGSFDVEIRSVNHRHLDARVRVPRALQRIEPELRARIVERFDRGKFDCSISVPDAETAPQSVEIDLEAARSYLRVARELAQGEGVTGELDVATLLALPGVARLSEPEPSLESFRPAALGALDEAMEGLARMRAAEGASLAADLSQRLDRVGEVADFLETRASAVQQAVRARLQKRMQKLQAETGLEDDARLQQELMIAADRLDVTEEIVRLRSHVEQFRAALADAGPGRPVGRRLEFLLQELSREANTIGSKGADAAVAHAIVDLKTELERLREQVMNVE
jgi:uncharacterized protein (TIGR00255 family)